MQIGMNASVIISNLSYAISDAGAAAMNWLGVCVAAFSTAPAAFQPVIRAEPYQGKQAFSELVRSAGSGLKLLHRTSRRRNATLSVQPIAQSQPVKCLSNVQQMRRVTSIVEDAVIRTVTVRDLHERTRTQLDAAEHALISLCDELAAIMPGFSRQPMALAA
jgi:hypothetical protein